MIFLLRLIKWTQQEMRLTHTIFHSFPSWNQFCFFPSIANDVKSRGETKGNWKNKIHCGLRESLLDHKMGALWEIFKQHKTPEASSFFNSLPHLLLWKSLTMKLTRCFIWSFDHQWYVFIWSFPANDSSLKNNGKKIEHSEMRWLIKRMEMRPDFFLCISE